MFSKPNSNQSALLHSALFISCEGTLRISHRRMHPLTYGVLYACLQPGIGKAIREAVCDNVQELLCATQRASCGIQQPRYIPVDCFVCSCVPAHLPGKSLFTHARTCTYIPSQTHTTTLATHRYHVPTHGLLALETEPLKNGQSLGGMKMQLNWACSKQSLQVATAQHEKKARLDRQGKGRTPQCAAGPRWIQTKQVLFSRINKQMIGAAKVPTPARRIVTRILICYFGWLGYESTRSLDVG